MAVTKNPCRYCINGAKSLNGKYYPGRNCFYSVCDNRKEYKEYLSSKRQFKEGETITALEDLLKQEWVMWYGATKHIEMFRSMPIRTVEMFLRQGAFTKAIRKGEE